jgi:hypothetical protein
MKNSTFQNRSLKRDGGTNSPAAESAGQMGSENRRWEQDTDAASNARGAIASKIQGTQGRNIHGGGHRNIRVSDTRPFPGGGFRRPMQRASCFELTTFDWNERTGQAFRDHMREEGLELKEIAQIVGCNPRTAENYVAGRNSPAGLQFLRSIAAIPTFAAAVREVTGQMGDLDPRAMHQAMKVMQEASRFLDAMGASSTAFDSSDIETDACEADTLTGDLFECVGNA